MLQSRPISSYKSNRFWGTSVTCKWKFVSIQFSRVTNWRRCFLRGSFPVNVYVLIEILFEETTTILNWNKLFFKISFLNCLVLECLYYKTRAFIFMFRYLKQRGNKRSKINVLVAHDGGTNIPLGDSISVLTRVEEIWR